MDLKCLVSHHCSRLGFENEVALLLLEMLEPLYQSLSGMMDLGIYFHSATRCEAACVNHGLPIQCGALLWSVCASLRDRIEGSIAVDRVRMQREESTAGSAVVPYVESIPLFGVK